MKPSLQSPPWPFPGPNMPATSEVGSYPPPEGNDEKRV